MALSSAGLRILEPASIRSMFVRVSPIPRSLSERRAVLRALQKYGEIEVFKSLIEPASFLSVAKQSSVVKRLAENSPLQFDVLPEQTDSLASRPVAEQVFKSNLLPNEAARFPMASHQTEKSSSDRNTFVLHIFPTETYKHKTNIRYSPLHGPWPDEKPSSFVTAALRVVVPKDMAGRALWDWETGGQSERTVPRKVDHIRGRFQRRENRSREKVLVGANLGDRRPGSLVEGSSSGKTQSDKP